MQVEAATRVRVCLAVVEAGKILQLIWVELQAAQYALSRTTHMARRCLAGFHR